MGRKDNINICIFHSASFQNNELVRKHSSNATNDVAVVSIF